MSQSSQSLAVPTILSERTENSNPEDKENIIDKYKELNNKCDIVLEKITKRKRKK